MVYLVSMAILYVGGWAYYVNDILSWGMSELEKPLNESKVPMETRVSLDRYPVLTTGGIILFVLFTWPVKAWQDVVHQIEMWKIDYHAWRIEKKLEQVDAEMDRLIEEHQGELEPDDDLLKSVKNRQEREIYEESIDQSQN